jgi:hypothetical protein
MTLPAWPSINSKPLRDSWSMPKPALAPLESDMDGGNTRRRARPGDNVAEIDQTIVLSAADYATYDAFYRATLGNGASRFTMSVWLGTGFATKTVSFIGMPTHAHYGASVSIAMKLRVFDM